MRYDPAIFPLESRDRAIEQLKKGDLIKAFRTCKFKRELFSELLPEFEECIDNLYSKRQFGIILSAIYHVGPLGKYGVNHLLARLSDQKDYPSFLKNAYRFDALDDFASEIKAAIDWHIARNLPDAEAWQRKLKKLEELRTLQNSGLSGSVEILEEETGESVRLPKKQLFLKPTAQHTPEAPSTPEVANESDPYIISRTAKTKMERANAEHRKTLEILRQTLSSSGHEMLENRLIDGYADLSTGPAIFEVKSLSTDNERDQVRNAISQLYEYRFLHTLPQASLWAVFSRKPDSAWLIEYLLTDRTIGVLWVQDSALAGPSLRNLGIRDEARG